MTSEEAKQLISGGESQRVEFKRSAMSVPQDVYPTVCSFLNCEGGEIFLGVEDDKTISGIKQNLETICDDLVNTLNNDNKIAPSFPLHPQKIEIDGRVIIRLQVPVSSQTHRCNNRVYIRKDKSDLEVKEPRQIAELDNKKRIHYSEKTIYPHLLFEDFSTNAFEILRRQLRIVNPSHMWLGLTNEQILLSASLYDKDPNTGASGYTLASALLFGTRQTLLRILPFYRLDALVRRINLDRFDDREVIEENLLESYIKLESFVQKHLPDPFFQEGSTRVSLREKIFREVIGNVLIHREYLKAERTSFIIESTQMVAINPSNPFQIGPLTPDKFSTHPKNPTIAKVFNELGWVDEIGSGVRNLYKYSQIYSNGSKPELIEGASFITKIPLPPTVGFYNRSDLDFGSTNPEFVGYNFRQVQLLLTVRPGQSITAKQYRDSLPGVISDTAARDDLRGLVRDGWFLPPVRGRGARYIRTIKAT